MGNEWKAEKYETLMKTDFYLRASDARGIRLRLRVGLPYSELLKSLKHLHETVIKYHTAVNRRFSVLQATFAAIFEKEKSELLRVTTQQKEELIRIFQRTETQLQLYQQKNNVLLELGNIHIDLHKLYTSVLTGSIEHYLQLLSELQRAEDNATIQKNKILLKSSPTTMQLLSALAEIREIYRRYDDTERQKRDHPKDTD